MYIPHIHFVLFYANNLKYKSQLLTCFWRKKKSLTNLEKNGLKICKSATVVSLIELMFDEWVWMFRRLLKQHLEVIIHHPPFSAMKIQSSSPCWINRKTGISVKSNPINLATTENGKIKKHSSNKHISKPGFSVLITLWWFCFFFSSFWYCSSFRLSLRYLLVFDETTSLDQLCRLIGQVASKEQPVTGLNLVSKPHEEQWIAAQS